MTEFDIGGRPIGTDEQTFVITEAGSNHDGDLSEAKRLVDAAAKAGADAVKFQTFRVDRLYADADDEGAEYDAFEAREMPYEWIPELADHCDSRGVLFMSTPFDERAVNELEPHVPAFKIASLTASDEGLLRHVAATGKPVVLSTGAQEIDEVRTAVETLRDAGVADLALLQCVSSYPTPLEEINVRVVRTLRETFDVPAGLSDHTLDATVAPTAAVALGGAIVEKHFTLDSSQEGLDHSYALEPDELADMVAAIHDTEAALGSGEKHVLDIETDLRDAARRSLQAVRDIAAGDTIARDDLAVLRPGSHQRGIEPQYLDVVVGATATADVPEGEGVTWDAIDEKRV